MSEFRQARVSSLPKLGSFPGSETRLFQSKDVLAQTAKILQDRFNDKNRDDARNLDEDEKPAPNRSLIQMPKKLVIDGFIPFKTINKQEACEIFNELKKIRSKSTLLKPHIKAEILLNKAEYEKIRILNEARARQQRDLLAKKIKQLTPVTMNKQVKIKQRIKKKTRNLKKIVLGFNHKLYQENSNIWKPYIDYDAIPVPIKDEVFFIGGRKKCESVVFNVVKSSWREIQFDNARFFGETDPSVVMDQKIMCFGGYDYFQNGFSLISNSLRTFDAKLLKVEVQQFPEAKTPCRAYHSQCLYGKFLIISGGLDKNDKLFNNFLNYNIDKKYWSELTVSRMPERLKAGFAKHQTLPVFHPRASYDIYESNPIIHRDDSISQEGVYMFGGEDSEGELIPGMHIMRLGRPSVVIEQLPTQGQSPIPRKNMKIVPYKGYLIVHGGRNDQMKPNVLNSIHFLSLKTLNWVRVAGEKAPLRYSHSLSMVGDQLLIMGGKSTEGLCKQVCLMPVQQVFHEE